MARKAPVTGSRTTDRGGSEQERARAVLEHKDEAIKAAKKGTLLLRSATLLDKSLIPAPAPSPLPVPASGFAYQISPPPVPPAPLAPSPSPPRSPSAPSGPAWPFLFLGRLAFSFPLAGLAGLVSACFFVASLGAVASCGDPFGDQLGCLFL